MARVKSHIHSLQSLGVAQDSYSSLLCPVLVGKLPSDLQLLISRKVSESDWKLDLLMQAIEDEVSARERIGVNQTHAPARRKEPPPSATSLMSSADVSCCYCDKTHSPSNCDVVTGVEARKQVLRRRGRCYACLRKGHLSRDCRSRSRCLTCGGRHHKSICDRGTETPRLPQHPPSSDATTSNVSRSRLNSSAPAFAGTPLANPTAQSSDSSTLYVDSSKMVLLQTAVAEVTNLQNPSRTLKLGIVFDGGSQKSYLTQRVKNALELPVSSMRSLSIATFGSRKGRPR